VNDFLGVGVVDRAEVERVCVLAVIWMWAIVHESLLKTDFGTEALVVANRPCYLMSVKPIHSCCRILTVAIHFVHVFWWDADQSALLNNLEIFPHNRLYDLQIFHRDL
jgi:hypothetical protein